MVSQNSSLPKCGASLTRQLARDRAQLIERIALQHRHVGLLFEGTDHHYSLNQKIETIQLNEIIRQYALISRITGNDLYSRIVRQTIVELRKRSLISPISSVLLREGFWDSVQTGMGSFAGGLDKVLKKIGLKKEPEGWEEAQRIFQNIAEKEGHKIVKDLVKAIEDETKDLETGLGSKPDDSVFPYNKNREVFFSGANTIASVYDSVVAATKKDSGEEGYLPVDVANQIIEQLRVITQKYIADTEREKGGMYASFGGGAAEEGLKGTPTGESNWMLMNMPLLMEQDKEEKDEGGKLDADKEYEKIMKGQKSPVVKRMGSLKAPLVIAGVGAALGALGWVAYQPWFHDMVLKFLGISKTTSWTEPDKVKSAISTTIKGGGPTDFGKVVSGEGGLAKQVTRLAGEGKPWSLVGKQASLDDLRAAAMDIGGGDMDKGLKGIAALTKDRGNPAEAFDWMKKALTSPDSVGVTDASSDGSLWKLFAGGTARAGGTAAHAMPGGGIFSVGIGNKLQGMLTKQLVKTVTKEVVKGAVKTGTTGAAASAIGMMTGAAPILAGMGVAAVGAGATLAYIRHRAKKKSRMGTLNDLLGKLDLLDPIPVTGVEPAGDKDTVVTITLHNPEEAAGPEEEKKEGWRSHLPLLNETTEVEITGLEGDPELEDTGGVAKFNLQSVSLDITPSVDDLVQIPFVEKGITDFLPDLDLAGPDVTVKIIDKRTKEDIPEEPPPEEAPPQPINPEEIAKKGKHAVVVFTPDGANIWRILKKVTYRKYASDAKKSEDKDAPEFADRYAKYDSILTKLRADGVFVNTDDVERELSKISSGHDGKEHRVTYTRTRKNKKTGETTKRKSSTGGLYSWWLLKRCWCHSQEYPWSSRFSPSPKPSGLHHYLSGRFKFITCITGQGVG